MLATMPEGEILWVNESYERLVGYTSAELIGKLTWVELTTAATDAENDTEMACEVVRGDRTDYSFRKSYRHKSGDTKPVTIHVMRYPLGGEFQWFLVSVIPIDGSLAALRELELIQLQLVEILNKKTSFGELLDFAKARPWLSGIVALLISSLLFGDRVLELLATILQIIRGT